MVAFDVIPTKSYKIDLATKPCQQCVVGRVRSPKSDTGAAGKDKLAWLAASSYTIKYVQQRCSAIPSHYSDSPVAVRFTTLRHTGGWRQGGARTSLQSLERRCNCSCGGPVCCVVRVRRRIPARNYVVVKLIVSG